MKEKKNDDRSSAEMPEVWQPSSMIDEEAFGAGDGILSRSMLMSARATEFQSLELSSTGVARARTRRRQGAVSQFCGKDLYKPATPGVSVYG